MFFFKKVLRKQSLFFTILFSDILFSTSRQPFSDLHPEPDELNLLFSVLFL